MSVIEGLLIVLLVVVLLVAGLTAVDIGQYKNSGYCGPFVRFFGFCYEPVQAAPQLTPTPQPTWP